MALLFQAIKHRHYSAVAVDCQRSLYSVELVDHCEGSEIADFANPTGNSSFGHGKILGTWNATQAFASNTCTNKAGNNTVDNTVQTSSTKEYSMVLVSDYTVYFAD